MITELTQRLRTLRQRKQLKNALEFIQSECPEQFELCLQHFLRECHVTKPRFYREESHLREAEGRRKIAMAVLQLLAEDDPQALITRLEQQTEDIDNV